MTESGREHVGMATPYSMSQMDVTSEAVFQTSGIKEVRGKLRTTDPRQKSGMLADDSNRFSRVYLQNFLIPVM